MAINKRDMGEALDRVAEAAAKLGLPLYATHFELVDGHTLSQLAAYGGMPSRYRHWSFGKLYSHYQAAYHFRQSRIYELVVNHEPAYAFVDRSLDLGSCLVVAAHVLAHVAYFRSHAAFEATSRDEVGVMAEHRRILERYSRRFGRRQVETFIDAGLVLADFTAESPRMRSIGESPDDVLGFLATSAPHLPPWQLHVLRVLHQEARYFWPQQLTKVGNEGYATFWHRRLLHALDPRPEEIIAIARLNAELVQVTSPQLNPYRLGYVLVNAAYEQEGDQGLIRVARDFSDATLVREYLDEPRARLAGVLPGKDGSWSKAKQSLLDDLDHAGIPRLRVDRQRSRPKGILHLKHQHTGRDLDMHMLPHALSLIAEELWPGGVELTTLYRNTWHRFCHDGREFRDEIANDSVGLAMDGKEVGND